MQQIADWLEELGMSEYAERFAQNRIDLSVLPDLTDQHLEKLGVALGDRLKILRAIRELSATTVAAQPAPSAAPVVQDSAERRQLTVMFCDLVGSTALSGRLDPEDLRGIIDSYHRCCTELIERNGGFVAKYMGDGVLAYFGYPQAHEHDAERAVRAGLVLVKAVPKLTTAAGSPLQVRVGIATGLVVVGDLIGAGAAQEQAVVGETPNLAARLQALAEPGTVVIASTTRRLTGGLFEYRDLGTVSLKGFAETVPAWQVIGPSAAESRFEAFHSTALTPLVGREEEVELLMRRWQRAKKGDGSVVLIAGEPGIGKSRIAQTIVERLGGEPHTRLRYFCSPHHQDSALYPSIAQLERAAGFQRDDTDEQRLDKLEAVLAQGTNDLSEAVPLLAELLSIPTGDRYPPLNLTPQKRKELTLRAQLAQVEGLAARQPLLMVFEDAHWSDPTTRESLDLLVDRVPTLRVLVIITFRPEFAPPWVGRSHVSLLSLNRLPPRQRAEMITSMTGGKALPKEIVDQIIDRTDGIPLFIEELTKAVVESGVLTDAGDRYTVAGPLPHMAIPTSLNASLLARLDRLAPVREVAQIGAALGRQFSHELISAVTQMPHRQLDDALAQLVSAELIFRRGTPPDAEYTFKHALVQDAAYSTLLRSRRQQLHARIATTIEQQLPEIAETAPELLGHHCAEAGLIAEAIGYYQKAADRAMAASANVEAIRHLRRGLELVNSLPGSPERVVTEIELQAALSSPLAATKGFAAPEVEAACERARQLSEGIERTPEVFKCLTGLMAVSVVRSNFTVSRQLSEQLIGIATEIGSDDLLVTAHTSMSNMLFWSGRPALVPQHFEAAISRYKQQHHSPHAFAGMNVAINAISHYAMALWLLGYPEQAIANVRVALSHAREISHAFSIVFALQWAAIVHHMRGDLEAEAEAADEMGALSAEHGFALFSANHLIHQGWFRCAHGEDQIAQMRQGLSARLATGCEVTHPIFHTMLARSLADLGRPEEGIEVLQESLDRVSRTGEEWWLAETQRLMGELLLQSNPSDCEPPASCFWRAIEKARSQQAKSLELGAASSLARLCRDQGKRAEARDLLAPIYCWFTEGFDTPVLQDAKALLDQLT